MRQWKCSVCGQVFEGDSPPIPCPVCSAGENAFSEIGNEAPSVWRCTVCNQVFEGKRPPVPCPICGAGESAFILEEVAVTTFRLDSEDRFVIIGGGIASLEAAKAIRLRNKTASIKLVCKEGVIPYNRPALSDVVGDGLSFEAIVLEEYTWYEQNSIELICDAYAEKINCDKKEVSLSNKKTLGYTKLLLATGSNAFMADINTDDSVPIVSLRSYSDADFLFNNAKNKSVVVIGGGILGIEAALALRERGCSVTVIELAERIMPLQADEYASSLLHNALIKQGITIYTKTLTEKIENGELILQNNVHISAAMCVMCIGVRSETTLAKQAGLTVNRGIVINNNMQTDNKYVYAAGDCAELDLNVSGLYNAAAAGGDVAGANMAGEKNAFKQPVAATAFEGGGITMFSAGRLSCDRCTTLVYEDKAAGVYKKLVYNNKLLCGAVLIGDARDAAKIISALSSDGKFSLQH